MAGPGRPGPLGVDSDAPGFAGSLRARLKPPADLSPDARDVFLDVVANCQPEHFQECDKPLLVVYAEAVEQARATAKLIRDNMGTESVLKAQRNALSAIFQLSMRLRVSPQARQLRKSLGSNTRPPSVNFYDRLQLEMGTDEEA